ncbi:MAG: hypothetical protein ACOX6O_07305 [Christensenellales bacterium]|jgi:hypothetical protein
MIVSRCRRTILFLTLCALFFGLNPCMAQTPETVEITTLAQHGGEVSYPALKNFANTFVQDSVNQSILTEGGIQEHLNALSTFTEAMPGNLKVVSTARVFPSSTGQGLLAVLIEAQGNLSFGLPTHRYTPLVFSLATGQRISCEQVFIDCEQARSTLEEELDRMLVEELSNYLDAGDLFPLPIERFLLTDSGISFFYPERGMTWLSGKSAFIHFHYDELTGLLNDAEGSALAGLDLFQNLKPGDGIRQAVENAVVTGTLPGMPVKIGENLSEVLITFPLLHDPEGFVKGRKYQLEDDRFRGSWVLSWDGQSVTGLFSRRINLFGFITGSSKLDDIKRFLGEPTSSVALGAEAAALYGVPEGKISEYRYAQGTLKLFTDFNQILSAVWLDGNKAE